MDKIHEVKVKELRDKTLELIVDGSLHVIDLGSASRKLAAATQAQLKDFKISPSGYGIHWPQVDEDLAIDPLIGVEHEVPEWKVAENTPDYKTEND